MIVDALVHYSERVSFSSLLEQYKQEDCSLLVGLHRLMHPELIQEDEEVLSEHNHRTSTFKYVLYSVSFLLFMLQSSSYKVGSESTHSGSRVF